MKHAMMIAAALLSLTAAGPMVTHAQDAPSVAAPPSGPFDHVPLTGSAYHWLEVMQNAGIVTGYINSGTYGGKREMTRYEFAVALARLLPAPSGGKSDTELAQAHAGLVAKLTQHPDGAFAFFCLLDEFQPLVNRLMDMDAKASVPKGQAVMAAKARLAELEPSRLILERSTDSIPRGRAMQAAPTVTRDTPFPDVPKDHWAYQSVETLRRAGILHGYPPAPSK